MHKGTGWLLAFVVVATGACKKHETASTAQCERMLDRYIGLSLSEDPGAQRLTTEDRARLRGKLATDILSEPQAKQVKERCRTDVTPAEYDCAVKAPTAAAWNGCIQ